MVTNVTIKAEACPQQEGRTGLVQFPLASFNETSRATERGDFC